MEKNMKNLKSTWVTLFVGSSILLASALAKADSYTLTLSSPVQTGELGDLLEFDATFTNNTLSTVYLNTDSFNVDAPLTLDDTAFLTTFAYDPSTGDYDVGPGDSFAGLLFTVTIPSVPVTPLGLYSGSFEIYGGDASDVSDVIGSANFDVEVTPEPPTWELMALALMGLLGMKSWSTYRRQTAA
jgi:hypothetical protein